jgi:VanZ family protein
MIPRRGIWLAAFWIALVAVTWLALTPQPPKVISGISDVVLHAFAFAVLTFLLAQAHFPRQLFWPMLLMALYGPLIEVLQGTFFGRAAEMKDFWVDLLGIAVGAGLFRLLGQRADAVLARFPGVSDRDQ